MQYLFVSADVGLRDFAPDLIHVQHSEMTLVHHQLLTYKRVWAPDAAYTFHSMNALGVPDERVDQRVRWRHLRAGADAALCHYPGVRRSLQSGGFRKPIHIQTSYGVDEGVFRPDAEVRREVRDELALDGQFVIGFAGRLDRRKGIDTLLEALPAGASEWSLLLVGDGPMREEIDAIADKPAYDGRIIVTGYRRHAAVARYMQAMDCFVHGSRTTATWIDTFPRAVVEAMATGVPVIGSDSGAIPHQLGDAGIVVPEGDPESLSAAIETLAGDPQRRQRLGSAGRRRAVEQFGQRALADGFYEIMHEVLESDDAVR
jgi:glycosyltransferase involved in cell wall biosynthesis